MIEERNGVFHLQNDSASYLFRVTQEGFLHQLHFGVLNLHWHAKVSIRI